MKVDTGEKFTFLIASCVLGAVVLLSLLIGIVGPQQVVGGGGGGDGCANATRRVPDG